jgi:hypothetical protein
MDTWSSLRPTWKRENSVNDEALVNKCFFKILCNAARGHRKQSYLKNVPDRTAGKKFRACHRVCYRVQGTCRAASHAGFGDALAVGAIY